MKTARLIAPLLFLLGLLMTANVQAQADLKARFEARLPQIDQMKKELVVGENNKGYLEARGSLSSAQKTLMNAENADRKTLYGMLASKREVSIDVVGKTRAAQIYEGSQKSAAQVWVQDAAGNWKRI